MSALPQAVAERSPPIAQRYNFFFAEFGEGTSPSCRGCGTAPPSPRLCEDVNPPTHSLEGLPSGVICGMWDAHDSLWLGAAPRMTASG